MVGLGHDVSFTVNTADGVWNCVMDGPDDSLDYDDCPVNVHKLAESVYLIGRPDFEPSETVVLAFNFDTMRVVVSGKDREGHHAFMEGTITEFVDL